jgi:beta-aspartyl-peptidase (threonine type)
MKDESDRQRRRWSHVLVAVLALTILAGLIYLQQWRFDQDAELKSGVGKVLDDQAAAWNRGDLDGFMTGYWKSDQLSFFSDTETPPGWEALRKRYQDRYESKDKNLGNLKFTDLEILPMGYDAAAVKGQWHLEKDGKSMGGLFTLLFRRMPDGWRIIHDHTSRFPDKPAAKTTQ